ncbi:MAG TPA: enoyl-CoA hydratase-related protein [Solirubrobacterales bacterium]|jgi:2-(1,2-epoxy-1,2-dihydrophenyl)acetyl-CoA isomerase
MSADLTAPGAAADVLAERRGAVAVLTLNRPEKMNALLNSTVDRLRREIEAAGEEEGVRAVLLAGAGRGFCAGADLEAADPDARRVLRDHYAPLIRAIHELELPVVAAVNGVAAGAGVSLALAADLVIAASDASFAFAFSRVGLIPDAGLTWMLPRLIGPARAFELIALGERIGAARALELGLLNRVVEPDRLLAEATGLAERLAAGPRAIGLGKRALRESLEQGLGAQLELEAEIQAEAVATEDFAEAIAAYREKREPSFVGR